MIYMVECKEHNRYVQATGIQHALSIFSEWWKQEQIGEGEEPNIDAVVLVSEDDILDDWKDKYK